MQNQVNVENIESEDNLSEKDEENNFELLIQSMNKENYELRSTIESLKRS